MSTRAAQQARTDAAAEDADGEGRVQPVHDAHAMARLDRRGLCVDRDVERPGAHADERERRVERRQGMRRSRECDRDPEGG